MKKKIIFFDIDGTLFSSQIGYVTDRVKRAVRSAQDKGYLCFIATGRTYGFIPQEIRSMGFDGYVCANGSFLLYHDQVLYCHYIPEEDVRSLYLHLKRKNLECDLQGERNTAIDRDNKKLIQYFADSGIPSQSIIHEYDLEERMKHTIKMEVWLPSQRWIPYILEYEDRFIYELHAPTHHVEFFNRGITKADGVLKTMELLEIPVENSYSFGDAENDIPVAKVVGHPIAMGNAVDALKECAQDICPSIEEDGVAVYLEALD